MPHRQVLYRITLGLLVAMLLISGCSKKNDNQAAAEPAAQEAASQTEEPTEEPTIAPTEAPTEEPSMEPTEALAEEPTAEPTEETSGEPSAESAAQPESPLAGEQPVSPLTEPQPESPLAAQAAEHGYNTAEPVVVEAEVKEGQALVVGTLISNVTGDPLNNTVVRFPKVNCPETADEAVKGNDAGEGCFWALSDAFTPGAVTSDDGTFKVEVEEPGEYMFLVGDMMTVYAWAEVTPDKAFRFMTEPDTAIDLGEITVDYQ